MAAFDDSPQWYWAAGDRMPGGLALPAERAEDRFVIACGQRELWTRVRQDVSPEEQSSWNSFGPADGKVSLADCFALFIMAREMYGTNFNRLVLELAQIPAFAKFVKDQPSDLANWISNPTTVTPLPRVAYDRDVERRLGQRIAATLGLEDGWWL